MEEDTPWLHDLSDSATITFINISPFISKVHGTEWQFIVLRYVHKTFAIKSSLPFKQFSTKWEKATIMLILEL